MLKLIPGTTLCLALAAALPLTAGAGDDGPRFLDRELLTDTLTLDEQEELPGAQQELAAAETELNAAIAERDAAALRVGELETALTGAKTALEMAEAALMADPTDPLLQAAVDDAMAEVARIDGELETAKQELVEKQTAVGQKQEVYDEKAAVVEGIENEIAATGELVGKLSDKQVQAFNNALHSSIQRGLLPFPIDSDLLQRAIDEGFGTGQIHHLVTAFRQEAQFERLALRFDEKYTTADKEIFLASADRARAKGAAEFDKFMAKVDAASARAEAKEAAQQALAEERRGLAKANGHDK